MCTSLFLTVCVCVCMCICIMCVFVHVEMNAIADCYGGKRNWFSTALESQTVGSYLLC